MSHYAKGLKLAAAGRHADAIGAFEAALREAPDDTHTLYALGSTARALGLSDVAKSFFGKVQALQPERIEAPVALANLLRDEGQAEAAIALIEPLLARMPDSAELWLTLGNALRVLDRLDAAQTAFRRALACRPDYVPALGNLADCLADGGDVEAALALYDLVLARDGGNAQARLNRAILQFLKGDLKAAWRDYAARLKVPGKAPKTAHGLKAWSGGGLKNTRLLITAEQGVGDQLMFASVIPQLAAQAGEQGGRLILECEPRLLSLFARSFPEVKVAAAQWQRRGNVVEACHDWLKALGGANAAIELGTLPRYLRRDLGSFPAPHAYLVPDAGETARWRQWAANLGGTRRLGICWRSGKLGGGRSLQFAPLEAWGAWLRNCAAEIVSVQYDGHAEELAALSALSGRTIHVPPGLDQKQELDRSCALLCALDAVVSAPTAVSWLSAGAGVATYKLVYDTSWTACGCEFEPFAPAARIIRPGQPGAWPQVFERLSAAL